MTLSNLRKTLQQLQPVLHNKKLNVGVVKESVGVAFTYPNIRLSAWFLESSGHCCSDNRGSTVLTTNPTSDRGLCTGKLMYEFEKEYVVH